MSLDPIEEETDLDLEENEESVPLELTDKDFQSIIIAPSDWTIETLFSQIGKQIDLDPAFQRRNVWNTASKSKFIESLILGIPIPQILLSAKPQVKNSYIVLDGKQRLLTIKEFIDGKLPNGRVFKLKGLRVLTDLEGKSWEDIQDDEDWCYRLLNETQRTAVIRGWQDERVLYEMFYRLNAGSVKLSPMELRMSLHPGDFLKYIIQWTEEIGPIHKLLSKSRPDPRMADVELAVRFLAFTEPNVPYAGNLKVFLDALCVMYNENMHKDQSFESIVSSHLSAMNLAIEAGFTIFGQKTFCRKYTEGRYETRFNRALFDILVGSLSNQEFRDFALKNPLVVRGGFEEISSNNDFLRSVETTTKSTAATFTRFSKWYQAVERISDISINMPNIER